MLAELQFFFFLWLLSGLIRHLIVGIKKLRQNRYNMYNSTLLCNGYYSHIGISRLEGPTLLLRVPVPLWGSCVALCAGGVLWLWNVFLSCHPCCCCGFGVGAEKTVFFVPCAVAREFEPFQTLPLISLSLGCIAFRYPVGKASGKNSSLLSRSLLIDGILFRGLETLGTHICMGDQQPSECRR